MSTEAGNEAPTTDETIAAMREVIEAWHADRPRAHLSKSADTLYGPVLFSHVAHVHRLAEGVLTLQAADQFLAAMPLVRQMIEFTLRAVWLTIYHENLPAMVREDERQRTNALRQAAKNGQIPTDDPALLQSIDWLDGNRQVQGVTSGQKFFMICEEVPGGESVYTHYRMASNYTHHGSMLFEEYISIKPTTDGKVAISFNTRPELVTERAWLNMVAYLLILAGITWDNVDRVHLHRELLRRLAVRYEVPTRPFDMNNVGYIRWNQAGKARDRAARDARRKKP
ncbi:DUF5677 domain-containing protein [Oerskovia paurometabola]|uniref:DUF5677 domain-containing protein n=1 Tax=Oerskovia paurometabola TaxID=162170 RepID=UPI0038149E23